MITGKVEKIGPLQSRLYVKLMAPRFVLVPTSVLPRGVGEGGEVRLVIQAVNPGTEVADGEESEERQRPASSTALFNGRLIRRGV